MRLVIFCSSGVDPCRPLPPGALSGAFFSPSFLLFSPPPPFLLFSPPLPFLSSSPLALFLLLHSSPLLFLLSSPPASSSLFRILATGKRWPEKRKLRRKKGDKESGAWSLKGILGCLLSCRPLSSSHILLSRCCSVLRVDLLFSFMLQIERRRGRWKAPILRRRRRREGEGWVLEAKRGGSWRRVVRGVEQTGGKCRLVGGDNGAFWERGRGGLRRGRLEGKR